MKRVLEFYNRIADFLIEVKRFSVIVGRWPVDAGDYELGSVRGVIYSHGKMPWSCRAPDTVIHEFICWIGENYHPPPLLGGRQSRVTASFDELTSLS